MGFFSKEVTPSPTPSNNSLMLRLLIDSMKQQVVGCGDIPSAYIQVKMKYFVFVKFIGESVDILCKTNRKYKKYATMEKGKKVIQLKLLKALYECVQKGLCFSPVF